MSASTSALPPGARPDLSVDGVIELEQLENVLYVERPAFGQENATVGLFKLLPDDGPIPAGQEAGHEAVQTPVKLGKASVQFIEVLEGLQEGDRVILSDMSQYDGFRPHQVELAALDTSEGVAMSTTGRPLINLDGVTKIFYTDEVETHALAGIHLEIQRGEYISIAGPSGCGKSTLLSILGLLDTPTEGSYVLNGRSVADLPLSERARVRNREIGFIFQSFNLIGDLTVYENVELPLTYRGMKSAERKERVMAALEKVGMSHRAKHLPSQLSGGQQQRVAVARAVGGSPSILLADEPTGNLDSKNGEAVMELLRELHREGATICMVTHDPRYARHAERSIHLFDGRVVEEDAARRRTEGPRGKRLPSRELAFGSETTARWAAGWSASFQLVTAPTYRRAVDALRTSRRSDALSIRLQTGKIAMTPLEALLERPASTTMTSRPAAEPAVPVLVADDQRDVTEALRLLLCTHDFGVVSAASPVEGRRGRGCAAAGRRAHRFELRQRPHDRRAGPRAAWRRSRSTRSGAAGGRDDGVELDRPGARSRPPRRPRLRREAVGRVAPGRDCAIAGRTRPRASSGRSSSSRRCKGCGAAVGRRRRPGHADRHAAARRRRPARQAGDGTPAGNVSRAARALGLSRSALYRRLERHKI